MSFSDSHARYLNFQMGKLEGVSNITKTRIANILHEYSNNNFWCIKILNLCVKLTCFR